MRYETKSDHFASVPKYSRKDFVFLLALAIVWNLSFQVVVRLATLSQAVWLAALVFTPLYNSPCLARTQHGPQSNGEVRNRC